MVNDVRQQVAERAGDRCEYCRLPAGLSGQPAFHVDHVVPRKHGGSDELTNLAYACMTCNLHKGSDLVAHDPHSLKLVPLFNPREHAWVEHFRVHQLQVTGTTPTGRATVRLLRLNEVPRLQVRGQARKWGHGWPEDS